MQSACLYDLYYRFFFSDKQNNFFLSKFRVTPMHTYINHYSVNISFTSTYTYIYVHLSEIKKKNPINNTGTHVYVFFTNIIDGNMYFIKKRKIPIFNSKGVLITKSAP